MCTYAHLHISFAKKQQGAEIGFASPKDKENDVMLRLYTEQKFYDKLIMVDDMRTDAAGKSIAEACKREGFHPDGVSRVCAW